MYTQNKLTGISRIPQFFTITHTWPVVIIYLVLAAMMMILTVVSPSFPSVFSLTNLMSTALPLVFAALAQTIVILVKGIDLSVGPAMSLVMVIAARVMHDSPFSVGAGILICLVVGALTGVFNGFFVVVAGLQPIIVTLASSSILAGLALFIMPQPGGYIPPALNFISTGNIWILPLPGLVLAAALLLVWFPLRKSKIGQSWYAVGGNETGAFYSGVNISLAKLSAFVAAGLFSGMGGLMLSFQTLTGDAMIGNPYTLYSIAATVLGGTILAGGRGSAVGALGGVLVLTIAVDILFFFQVSAYFQYVFSGAIVIIALAFVTFSDSIREKIKAFRTAVSEREADNG